VARAKLSLRFFKIFFLYKSGNSSFEKNLFSTRTFLLSGENFCFIKYNNKYILFILNYFN